MSGDSAWRERRRKASWAASRSADFPTARFCLFVTRTLQPQLDDADAPNVFAKLQSLKDILRQQEMTLPDWPDCAGKDRMRDALAVASDLIAQISDDLAGAAKRDAAVREAKSA